MRPWVAAHRRRRPSVTGVARPPLGSLISTIYLRISRGTFPAPVSLGGRAVGWIEAEVQDVDQVEGFAPASGREELAVAGGGPPGAPEGGHRQRGLGLDDDGQRSVERVAFHVPAGDAHQLPEPVRGRGLGHLAQGRG